MGKLASPAGLAIDSDAKLRAEAKPSHIMVWRYADAPHSLQLLHRDLPAPEWLVFVPHDRKGLDLDESIIGRPESIGVLRYETPSGDVVYTGSSLMSKTGKHFRTAKGESPASISSSHA